MKKSSITHPLSRSKQTWQAATGVRLFLALASSSLLAISGYQASANDSLESNGSHKLEVVVNDDGHLSVKEKSHKHTLGYQGLSSPLGFDTLAAQSSLEKLSTALMRLVARSTEFICDLPVSPSNVTLSIEVIQIQWSKKELCKPQSRHALAQTIADDEESSDPQVTFKLPKNLLSFGNIKDYFDRQKQIEAFQNFSSELLSFFCKMPVRPDEVSLKAVPAKVEWDISDACKHRD